ncbi:hypothetical protein [Hymenobacter sp. HDW8]|uniref:hypothetical protein n=1 Tax=Hymenobacter sp. HDW8 TaxID=2714932 RepID=UPI001408B717|nr:hypothetical protein [Hymenobacter sp. HDW8]QIL78393.1 hypothetical protein G7064_21465 [Hymenobacter sp. HDW8]
MSKQSNILKIKPIVRHFRHSDTKAIIVVRGELANYYALSRVEAFTGTGARDAEAAQLLDMSFWKQFTDAFLVEVDDHYQRRILHLASKTSDQATDVTNLYNGPFRLSGREYNSLLALLEGLQSIAEQFSGRTVDQQGKLTLFVFEQQAGTTRTSPWELVSLGLSAQPIDSYAYLLGRRAAVEKEQSHGTVTLWQEEDGMRRYYVETAANHVLAPAFPRLELLTVEQVRDWYDFKFAPGRPPTQ